MREIRHDGHRIIAYLERARCGCRRATRNDATARSKPIAELLAKLPARRAIVDGEVAVPEAWCYEFGAAELGAARPGWPSRLLCASIFSIWIGGTWALAAASSQGRLG